MGADDADWEPKPCSGLNDLFFSEDPKEQEVAKAICGGCTHGVWCGQQALAAIANGETGGVWAGMTLAELREGLADAERNRARTAGHPSAVGDAVPELLDEPGLGDRDLRAVPPGADTAAGA